MKMWCIYTTEYQSYKRNNAICSNIDEPKDYNTKPMTCMIIAYIWNLKSNTNEFTYKTNRPIDRKQTSDYQMGRAGEG